MLSIFGVTIVLYFTKILSGSKNIWNSFVQYEEVGDTFIPHMEVSFPLASNDETIE
jgi:hypothetical protein